MEDILEGIYELILDYVLKSWNDFMKKRNPDYENTRSKTIISIIIGVVLMLLLGITILGILLLVKWVFTKFQISFQ